MPIRYLFFAQLQEHGGPFPTFWPKSMPEIFPFGSKAKLNTANDSTLQEEPKSAKKIFISFRPFVIKILLATFLDVLTAMSFWNIYAIYNTYTSNKLFHSSTDEDRGRIIIEENNSPTRAEPTNFRWASYIYPVCPNSNMSLRLS